MNDNQGSLQKALSQNWGLTDTQTLQMEDLRKALQIRIAQMLQDDLHALVQAMYRLDIDENKFHAAMAAPGLDRQVSSLSDLIIEREIQRIEFRERFRNNPS